jgi:hypothetical protein
MSWFVQKEAVAFERLCGTDILECIRVRKILVLDFFSINIKVLLANGHRVLLLLLQEGGVGRSRIEFSGILFADICSQVVSTISIRLTFLPFLEIKSNSHSGGLVLFVTAVLHFIIIFN